jgi:hypothetical protein
MNADYRNLFAYCVVGRPWAFRIHRPAISRRVYSCFQWESWQNAPKSAVLHALNVPYRQQLIQLLHPEQSDKWPVSHKKWVTKLRPLKRKDNVANKVWRH